MWGPTGWGLPYFDAVVWPHEMTEGTSFGGDPEDVRGVLGQAWVIVWG